MTEAWMTTNDNGEVCNTLDELEDTIEQGLQTFIEVGQALAEIRDRRLYRNDFDTFEAYCADRWNLSRPRAYQLIEASEVVRAMSTTVDTPLPNSERQARELAPLRDQPEAVRDVWEDVQRTSAGKPTAALVRDAVKRHLAAVPAQAPQDEEFWNDAAEKLTANGWVAKRDAERPFSLAMTRLSRLADDITDVSIDPAALAENIPEQHADSLPRIEAAYQWLHQFVMSQKEF